MFKQIIKQHLTSQAPQVESNLLDQCTAVLEDVSKKHKLITYDLCLLFKVQDELLVGQIITQKAEVLEAFDAGALFTAMLQEQLQVIPEQLHEEILEQLGGEQLEQLLIKLFKKDYLLIRYNKEQSLELQHITATSSKKVNIQSFIEKLEL